MKNLVIGVVGDSSLHKMWIDGTKNFDLFLVYYGEIKNRYENDGTYYANAKGSKFLIVDKILQDYSQIISDYDAVLVPDDDLIMIAEDINRFFNMFHEYNLEIAQPAIIGWLSVPMVAPTLGNMLRYTNWVEIMTPCFSKDALLKCQHTFSINRTNWGLDSLWHKIMGEPKDKFAVIDDVVAIHTRPCFYGDTYHRNNNSFDLAWQELRQLMKDYNLSLDKHVYGCIARNFQEFHERPSEQKVYPNCPFLLKKLQEIHELRIML